tara:strand:+ start:88 stop:876 length:789 start_codon:yes stop_codon:yes gene_type:complete
MKNLSFLALLIITMYSCKEEVTIENTQASKDHLIAENIFHYITNNIEAAFNPNQNVLCPNYTTNNTISTDQDTIIVDFGEGLTTCINNNNIESGKIIVIYDGNYYSSGTKITSTFDNYYINNSLIQGSLTIENKGRNDNDNMMFDIEVNDGIINTSDGIINWEAELEKEWYGGEATSEISDDKYKITGEANGIARNNNGFKVNIEDPLKVKLECLPHCIIKEGSAEITPDGYEERIINYGDSICDCRFEIDLNENSFSVFID